MENLRQSVKSVDSRLQSGVSIALVAVQTLRSLLFASDANFRFDMKRACLFLATLVLAAKLPAQNVLVKPYVQPGNGSLLQGADVKVIAWLTDQVPADFTVEFGPKGVRMRSMKPSRVALDFKPPVSMPPPPLHEEEALTGELLAGNPAATATAKTTPTPGPSPTPEKPQHYFKWAATLTGLPFDSEIVYRVKLGDKLIREGVFKTRASAQKPIRFVMVGDLADGKPSQKVIAHQISLAKPDFLVVLGDIVYPNGRVSEYLDHFWGTYCNPDKADAKTGAPLMASVPFYPVLGNHDVERAKLPQVPDAYGAYYFFHPPLNGPGAGIWTTPLGKEKSAADAFRAAVGVSYPALDAYSFDDGPAHFLVLNSAGYVDPANATLRAWIEKDLRATTATWKFACFHAPAFQGSREHWTEQKMRLLEPIFEATGVDVVFAGHVHNYQRSFPFSFTPTTAKRDDRGRWPGEFVFDQKFDGKTNTQAAGIIHIVSGGGGAHLYGTTLEGDSAVLKKAHAEKFVPLTAKYVTNRHSFTLVEATPARLEIRALDEKGAEIDRVVVTKPTTAKLAEPAAPAAD